MERQAFEKLALAELDAVYRYARFLSKDAARAEDLVQDVYVKALRESSASAFEDREGGMRAWLFTIARNTYYRSVERDGISRRALRLACDFDDTDAPHAAALDRIDWATAGPRLAASLNQMSEDLAEVLWLWAVAGLKYREIAAALDTPIGTVMSRLHRARTHAARVLTERAEDGADHDARPDSTGRRKAAGEARHG